MTCVETLLSKVKVKVQRKLSACEGEGVAAEIDLFEDSPIDLKPRVNVKQTKDSNVEQQASCSKQNIVDVEEEKLQVKRARKRVKKKLQELEQYQN